jgi:hypothetical protein
MKAHKTFVLVTTALATLAIVATALSKLTRNAEAVAALTKTGVGPYITLLGVLELVFVALFLYPKTMKLGFAFLSCYLAGAMAAELSHGGPVQNAAIPLLILWIAAFLRDRTVFLPAATT